MNGTAYAYLVAAIAGIACGWGIRAALPPNATGSDSGVAPPSIAGPQQHSDSGLASIVERVARDGVSADVVDALSSALKKSPKETMALVFHELSFEVSLELLPGLGSALADYSDAEIVGMLSAVRTEREMNAAWDSVLAARLAVSPESAVRLASKAPPFANPKGRLVSLAAGSGGTEAVLALVDAGAGKSWICPPYPSKADWVSKLKEIDGLELLQVLEAKFGDSWTHRDEVAVAEQLTSGTPNVEAVIARLVDRAQASGDLSLLPGLVLSYTERNQVALTAGLINRLPEGFSRRALQKRAIGAAFGLDKEVGDSLRELLPPAESVTALQRPVKQAVEFKVLSGGINSNAFEWALSDQCPDPSVAIPHAVSFSSEAYGTNGLLKSLAGLSSGNNSPQIFGAVADHLTTNGIRTFDEASIAALNELSADRRSELRDALRSAGNPQLAHRIPD